MSTNLDICTDAYRALGIIGETETPSSEQGQKAIRRMNQIVAQEGEAELLFPSWFPQTTTAATCPIPDWAEVWLYTAVAMGLAADYGVAISNELVTQFEDARAIVLRKRVIQKMQPVCLDLPRAESGFNDYSILNG